MSKITKEQLINNLKALGLTKGDVVFVRADLGSVGRTEERLKDIIIDVFFDVLGEEGTLVSLSFTKQFPIFKVNKDYVFDKKTKSTSGAFPNIMLEHPSSFRSSHPTSSIVAIGKKAEYLTFEHDEKSLCYYPMKKLVELDAKMMLIGCVESNPGFTTVHLVQQELGLTKRNILCGLVAVKYKKDNQVKTFVRKDIGGCSKGFNKFYEEYEKKSLLKKGLVGKAESILIRAKEAYDLEYELLKKNNKFFMCDNEKCLFCRATWKFNKLDWPKFYLKNFSGLVTFLRRRL